MGLTERIVEFITGANPVQEADGVVADFAGVPVARYNAPIGYVDRLLTPELLQAERSVPVVFSSLLGLGRLCFGGFDHKLSPIDPSDDGQEKQIDTCMAEIRRIEKRIGRVGKAKNTGTLGLIRATALDGWSFGKAFVEKALINEAGWMNFADVQLLPAQSFGMSVSACTGPQYIVDKILPGVIFDTSVNQVRCFQAIDATTRREIAPENLIYIQDAMIPEDLSFIKVLAPVIEAWKEVRRYGMTAEKRVAVPNAVASLESKDLAALVASKIPIDIKKMIAYAESLTKTQGNMNQKVTIPGIKLSYPSISMPLDPWEADAYLKKEIVDFFFHRDILEVTAQAISATNAPAKDLLDIHIASERECWAKPFEDMWSGWLLDNGWELQDTFDWWDWAPKDQTALVSRAIMKVNAGIMLVNDARRECGDTEYDEAQLAQLKEERAQIKPVGAGSKGGKLI